MQVATNTPYVKRYHEVDGVRECGNSITKDNPYRNDGSNRRNRKPVKERFRSNKKGISLIVHRNVVPDAEGNATIVVSKYKRVLQTIKANIITKMVGKGRKAKEETIVYKEKTVGHYKLMN